VASLTKKTGVHLSKYVPDILCILLAVTMAYVFAGKATADLNAPSSPKRAAAETVTATKAGTTMPDQSTMSQDRDQGVNEPPARNVFAANGAYADLTTVGKPLPKNPYTLIAIVQGKETKALFRDYTGSMITTTVGQKMIDGSSIVAIGATSVKLKNDKEEREVKLFDILHRKRAMPGKADTASTKQRQGIGKQGKAQTRSLDAEEEGGAQTVRTAPSQKKVAPARPSGSRVSSKTSNANLQKILKSLDSGKKSSRKR
jgi:hypothetical protein